MSVAAPILILLLLGQVSTPEEPDLSTRFLPESGMGYCRQDGWATLEIRLSNPTEKGLKGRLVVRAGEALDTSPLIYASSVSLPPKSSRKMLVPIYAKPFRDEFRRSRPVTTRLTLGGGHRLEEMVSLAPLRDRAELVVGLGGIGKEGGLGYLHRPPTSWHVEEGEEIKRDRAIGTARDLPPDAIVLRAADAIVLTRMALWDLSPAQQEALVTYVTLGGSLVVATAEKGVPHQETLLDEILPAVPTSYGKMERWERLCHLFSDGTPIDEAPVPIQGLEIRPGASYAIWEGDHPIWVEGRYGAGRVAVLAFDILGPSIPDWRSKDAFAQWLLYGPEALPILPNTAGAEERDRSGLTSPVGRKRDRLTIDRFQLPVLAAAIEKEPIPSTSTILGVVLGYLILIVPVNYAFWRRRGRLEGAWVTAVVLAVLSTGGIVIWGFLRGGRPIRVWEMELEGGVAGARGRMHQYRFALQSARRRTVDLEGSPGLRYLPYVGKGKVLRGTADIYQPDFTATADPGRRGLEVDAASYHFLDGRAVSCLPGPVIGRIDESGGRWQGVADLGWEDPPDGAILFTADGWSPLKIVGRRGSLLSVDVRRDDLESLTPPIVLEAPYWDSRLDLDRAGRWKPLIVDLLEQAAYAAAADPLSPSRGFILAWRQESTSRLVPAGEVVGAVALRVLLLDIPEPPPAEAETALRWFPRIEDHKTWWAGRRRYKGMCTLAFVPNRTVSPDRARDLHLQMARGARVPDIFDLRIYDHASGRRPTVGTDQPIPAESPLEEGTGIASVLVWYGRGPYLEALRSLSLNGVFHPEEER